MAAIATPRRPTRLRARGITLVFALITLAVLALAAVGLLRSVDTSARILGNLGLKHDTVRFSDSVAEQAITWIKAQSAATLQADGTAGSGYYATSLDALDPTGSQVANISRALVDWDGDNCVSATSGTFTTCKAAKAGPADAAKGIKSSYVITRLCTVAGSATAAGNNCAVPLASGTVTSTVRGGISYGDSLRATGTTGQYYRILIRTKGARNASALTETIVHF